jgi:phospholipase/carboxylesterase
MNRLKPGDFSGVVPADSSGNDNPQGTVAESCFFGDDASAAGCPGLESGIGTGGNWSLDSGRILGEINSRFCLPTVSLFLPLHYETGHRYPVFLWLHADGGGHHELSDVMPRISDRNYLGVAIAGHKIGGGDRSGRASRCGWQQSAEAIELLVNQIAVVLDSMSQRFAMDRRRVFIGGSESGGTMAFRVAFERPAWFAGVASLNGSLPENLNPLGNWRTARGVPVFWSHGRCSAEFPETRLCHQLRLLHVAGFDVTLRQYPAADELPQQVFGDLNRWMMEQVARQGANIIG